LEKTPSQKEGSGGLGNTRNSHSACACSLLKIDIGIMAKVDQKLEGLSLGGKRIA
jgi:hypothetical protein